jgi:hypothetical protein
MGRALLSGEVCPTIYAGLADAAEILATGDMERLAERDVVIERERAGEILPRDDGR